MLNSPDADLPVWLDGEWLPGRRAGVHLDDPGWLAGLGVFETLAVCAGRPVDVDAHLQRWDAAGTRLRVPQPLGRTIAKVSDSLGERMAGDGWIKWIATRGGHAAVFAGRSRGFDGDPTCASATLLAWRVSPDGPLTGLKTLNYGAMVLGREEAVRRGFDEGIWLNTRGHLAEGCASNVFVVRGGKLFTPDVRSGILPGITRAQVIALAREEGLAVHEGKVRLKRLETADEAFLTSSVRGVRALVRLDGRCVGGESAGEVTRRIARRLFAHRRESIRTTG